jgi:hypothetical protein
MSGTWSIFSINVFSASSWKSKGTGWLFWQSTLSYAPSQRTDFLHSITFSSLIIPLPIEFNDFFKLAHILLMALRLHLRIGMKVPGIEH